MLFCNPAVGILDDPATRLVGNDRNIELLLKGFVSCSGVGVNTNIGFEPDGSSSGSSSAATRSIRICVRICYATVFLVFLDTISPVCAVWTTTSSAATFPAPCSVTIRSVAARNIVENRRRRRLAVAVVFRVVGAIAVASPCFPYPTVCVCVCVRVRTQDRTRRNIPTRSICICVIRIMGNGASTRATSLSSSFSP